MFGLILVVLFNSVVYTDFTGSWIVSWWRVAYCYCFWRFGGGVVIHWLTNEVSGGGLVLGES